MACRKRELREEGKIRNDAAAAAALGDALLFTTMCIIGMSVDVHARDGSVYSGIFHTASVDNDYGLLLTMLNFHEFSNSYLGGDELYLVYCLLIDNFGV